jgi:2-polyprenyl-3-methyl-5-hydroxy-6-metoxy-1,4-benzoquinol methylase
MIGKILRRVLGKNERRMVDLYRSLFMNVDSVVTELSAIPGVKRYLEIGCGDGAICSRIALKNPEITVTGIDIAPLPGKLYSSVAPVEYRQSSVEAFVAKKAACFDLVYIGDVLHHIAEDVDREAVLRAAAKAVDVSGCLILKEWERRWSLHFVLGWLADRFITGDRVRYMNECQLVRFIEAALPDFRIQKRGYFQPGPCNIFFVLRRVGFES